MPLAILVNEYAPVLLVVAYDALDPLVPVLMPTVAFATGWPVFASVTVPLMVELPAASVPIR